jgi:hypothetical protein
LAQQLCIVCRVFSTTKGFVITMPVQKKDYPIFQNAPWNRLTPDARLMVLRAKAIDSYANLEMTLSTLFGRLLGVKPDVAGIILFRVTNAGARNSIVEKILHHRYGKKYNLYWNSVKALLRPLDQRRNEIVHWHMATYPNFGRTGKITSASAILAPLNIWERRRSKGKLREKDLADFALKCEFVEAALWHLAVYGIGRIGKRGPRSTWQDILRRPIDYPPAPAHPICLMWPKRVFRVQASR